jgi:hypothetical protein
MNGTSARLVLGGVRDTIATAESVITQTARSPRPGVQELIRTCAKSVRCRP